VSLRVSADERCLFCTAAAPGVEPGADDRAADLPPGRYSTLWSTCLECGFSVPIIQRSGSDLHGDVEAAESQLRFGSAFLILPPESVIFFYPATPEQLLNSCYELGFAQVFLELLGDELVAREYLRLWDEQDDESTWIRSTSPIVVEYIRLRHPALLPKLAPVVTPGVALARYLWAAYGSVPLVYAGLDAPGGTDDDQDHLPFITLAGLRELFRRRGIAPAEQSGTLSRVPAERRRHLSVPGGLPRDLLDSQRLSSRQFRKIRNLKQLGAVDHLLGDADPGLGFLDVLPFEGMLDHPGLGPPDELHWRRSIAELVNLPRAERPVIQSLPGLDLSIVHEAGPSGLPRVEIEDLLASETTAVEEADVSAGNGDRLATCPFQMGRQYLRALRDARHDALTGLYSYGAFRERLEEEFSRANRYDEGLALVLMDLDRFKIVNDTHGHSAGNDVLRAVASTLQRLVRQSDFAARFGGDELAIILLDTDMEGAYQVAWKIQEELGRLQIPSPAGAIQVSASIGLAYYDGAGDRAASADELFADADSSLYIAKAQGGATVHPHFTEELTQHEP
jgi:diguanylate cyclase (GGDEF)-like protein